MVLLFYCVWFLDIIFLITIIIIIIVSRDTIGMRVWLSAWEDDSNSNK